jgi:hypothetical protein
MHTDHAFLMGTSHAARATPCQDYCLSAVRGEDAWAIVADGCSTGGNTELGARAWTQAAHNLLQEHSDVLDTPELETRVLHAAGPELDKLEHDDGYATLAILQKHGHQVRATFFGDGALLARHADGTVTLINSRYTFDAPRYLNYFRDEGCVKEWDALCPGQELLVMTYRYDEDGQMVSSKVLASPGAAGPWCWAADAQDLELVLIATDGIDSRSPGFFKGARELLDVKSFTGDFLQRHLGELGQRWGADGTLPGDDLAVAGLWFGDHPA